MENIESLISTLTDSLKAFNEAAGTTTAPDVGGLIKDLNSRNITFDDWNHAILHVGRSVEDVRRMSIIIGEVVSVATAMKSYSDEQDTATASALTTTFATNLSNAISALSADVYARLTALNTDLTNKINDNTSEDVANTDRLDLRITNVQSDLENFETHVYGTFNTMRSEYERYTNEKIADLVDGAPEALDTLKEIADELKDNDSAVEAILTKIEHVESDTALKLSQKEYNFNYYDENYSKKDNEHFKHNIDTFMRAAVVEQKKKGSPFRPKVFLTDDGVNLPKHENGKDILGSIPWRQGTFNGNHQFDGHLFVRPDIRKDGWSANDAKYVDMIATSKKYVDGINRQKRCIAPYSKCLYLDKRYIKSVDGEKGEGESLVFAYREVPQNVTRVCAEVTLEFDYSVPGAGVAIAIAVRNETSSKAVKYLAWFTLLENKVELKYNHLKYAVFDKVIKFDAGIGAFYNVDHDKAFTLSLEYTDEYIACYVNGTCIKKVTDHDRSYAGGMRPTLLIGPSEEMSGTVRVHSAGFGVNHSAMSYADFDELQLGHLPEWSASAPICGIEQGAGVDKWNVVETGYDGTMSVNSGYVNGKIKSIVSEALSNIGIAEGGSY